jgi:phage gp16-like protein
MNETQEKTMSDKNAEAGWTPEEIAQVLKTAELLKQKGSAQKINVAAFSGEIGLSRKNAYKHKHNHEQLAETLKQQLESLQSQHAADAEKIRLLENQLEQAEVSEKLRLVMRELIIDYQKKEPANRPRRRKLIAKYNRPERSGHSLGLAPLSL